MSDNGMGVSIGNGDLAERGKGVATDLKAQLGAAAGKAIDAAASTYSSVADKAASLTDGGAESISKMTAGVADTLRDGVETQKKAGANAVASLARSARDAAGGLEETSPQVARLVRVSADAVEKASDTVRDQSLGELIDAASGFAKRQPVAFFGCGILAGFVLARLLAPSSRT